MKLLKPRAIQKGSGAGKDAAVFELVTFEGMTPQGVPVLGKGLLQRSRMTIVDPAAVTRLTGFDSVRELRRDRIGLTRIAAGAHIENDVRHRLQEMLAMLARRLA